MSTQPEALRLADALETAEISYTSMVKAAAELRRLQTQRDALLEALKLSRAQWIHSANSDVRRHQVPSVREGDSDY